MFSLGPRIADPLVLLSLLDLDLGTTWDSRTSRLTLCFLLAISPEIKLLLYSAIRSLRIEPHRLDGSCIHRWGRMKVLATLKPQGLRVERGDSQQCRGLDAGEDESN